MGFLDDLKDKAEEFGEKAKEGFGTARERAGDLIGDAKDRFDGDSSPSDTPADTPADKVEAAAVNSPEAVQQATQSAGPAVAAAGEPGAGTTDFAVDSVGDATDLAADPVGGTGDTAQDRYDAVLDDAAARAGESRAEPGSM